MYNTKLYNEVLYNQAPLISIKHYLIDGSYVSRPYPINRILVAGYDTDGYPVYGSYENDTEIGLVGERWAPIYVMDVVTSSALDDIAEAIYKRGRMGIASGYVVAPVNLGIQLWDVISITDTPCDQAGDYRVIGIQFKYTPGKMPINILLLGAV